MLSLKVNCPVFVGYRVYSVDYIYCADVYIPTDVVIALASAIRENVATSLSLWFVSVHRVVSVKKWRSKRASKKNKKHTDDEVVQLLLFTLTVRHLAFNKVSP